MAYVTVPKDLTHVKSKVLFGLTKRQLVCFGGALLTGGPLYFLARNYLSNSAAALLMIFAMLPGLLFALFERHGQPLEVVIQQMIQCCFIRPKERPYDIKLLREAVRSDQPEDKLLLWLSRPSGTFCFRERDVLLKDTQAYNTWKFCGEQTHDRILAYAVELTGAANGTVQGNLYELDYQQHFQHIRDAALPVGANRLIYESGMREIGPKEHFDSRPDKYFGEFVRYEMQPRDPELLQAAIRQEQRSREPARPSDFKEHLAALHAGLIEAEAQRIATDIKRLAAPNSPDKNHFMVEVSPYFTKLASSRDTDRLIAMLPYKSLHLSGVKDRFGIYALVDKNENRDKNIRKPCASVRKQLSETKQAASPKKAAACSKQHEMEV